MSPNTEALINVGLILSQVILLVAGLVCIVLAVTRKTRKKIFAAFGIAAIIISASVPYITSKLLNVTLH